MIHESIEFHNAAALEPIAGLPGLCPVRFPRPVRDALEPRGRIISLSSTGIELRFVTPAPELRVTLQAHLSPATIRVYCGGHGHSDHVIPAGSATVLHLTAPTRFRDVPRDILHAAPFSPGVWRIILDGQPVNFLGVETFGHEIRPPRPPEKPNLRWLAHGSSITHSSVLGYPHRTAWKLGVDVLNKGMSGSCHCEAAMAAHLATAEEWDFATLELGINMRGGFEPDEFEKRARHLVSALRATKPRAPIILITHFLNKEHHPAGEPTEAVRRQNAFDATLRAIAAENQNNGIHLVEGCTVLTDLTGLGVDLIHPSDLGHTLMAENLARALEPIIAPLRSRG